MNGRALHAGVSYPRPTWRNLESGELRNLEARMIGALSIPALVGLALGATAWVTTGAAWLALSVAVAPVVSTFMALLVVFEE